MKHFAYLFVCLVSRFSTFLLILLKATKNGLWVNCAASRLEHLIRARCLALIDIMQLTLGGIEPMCFTFLLTKFVNLVVGHVCSSSVQHLIIFISAHDLQLRVLFIVVFKLSLSVVELQLACRNCRLIEPTVSLVDHYFFGSRFVGQLRQLTAIHFELLSV